MFLVYTATLASGQEQLIITRGDTVRFNIMPDTEEYAILKAFYEATDGSHWKRNSHWLEGRTAADFDKWFGVTVQHGDVVGLDLKNNNLNGSVPPKLYNLARLKAVDLEKNNLAPADQNVAQLATKPNYGFIENKGQIVDQHGNRNNEVLYMLPLPGNNILLTRKGFSYDTYITEEKDRPVTHSFDTLMHRGKARPKDVTYKHHRIDVELVGMNPQVEILAQDPFTDQINYYTHAAQTTVQHYAKVYYRNVYPGIDLEFIASPGQGKPVEYNFIVHPGVDLDKIKMLYKGASEVTTTKDSVRTKIDFGELTEKIPLSYWKKSNQNAVVHYREELSNDGIKVITFKLDGKKLNNDALIIDPTPNLSWGSYFGGNIVVDIDLSKDGWLYVAGDTDQASGIATSGAHKTTYSGNRDGFLMKFTSSGARIWGTYIGGSGLDDVWDMEVDFQGNIFVTGQTNSTSGIATSGSHDTSLGGIQDIFIQKFTSLGTRVWGTYYGGSDSDSWGYLDSDSQGNIVILGLTSSTSGISTTGVLQPNLNGSVNNFIVKFSGAGVRTWGTYYGINDSPFERAIKFFGDKIVLAGRTRTNGYATPGAHKTSVESYDDGTIYYADGLITVLNAQGSLHWSTYYGGYFNDCFHDIEISHDGAILLIGTTSSSNKISTPGAYIENEPLVSLPTFLVKFNAIGERLWGTYLDSNDLNVPLLETDGYGNIYTFTTTNNDGLGTLGVYKENLSGSNSDTFIMKLTPNGFRTWASYYGGTGLEYNNAAVVDFGGRIYIAGHTGSLTGISTPGSFDETTVYDNGTWFDDYLTKFSDPTCNLISNRNLPFYPLSAIGLKDQLVDFTSSQPQITALQGSNTGSTHQSNGVAMNDCGYMAFYTKHDISSDLPNRLHIYAADGTRLTNENAGSPLLALSKAAAIGEVQVVQVPGTTNQWYIVYSLWQSPCNSSSAYCPARMVYAKVQYNLTTQSLAILNRDVDIALSVRFIQGMAVSASVNGNPNQKYLYLAQRNGSTNDLKFHRFIIDANGIGAGQQSANYTTIQFWSLSLSNAALELSSDGNFLAMGNRNDVAGFVDLVVFDVSRFTDITYVPEQIKVPELMVDFNWQGIQTRKSIAEMSTTSPYSSSFSCFQFIKNKLDRIEFSPSGQYLYVTGGGYEVSSGNTSYLLQIDLLSKDVNGKYTVKIQVQNGDGTGSCSASTMPGTYTPTSRIQAAYDGRIYFTKGGSNKLYVIPNPDCPMPQNLFPADIDFATPSVPNITITGATAVSYLPEQIDGFIYPVAPESPVSTEFSIAKTLPQTVELTVANYNSANQYLVNWGDGSSTTVTSGVGVPHYYAAEGTYSIKLVTTVGSACPVVAYQNITIPKCWQLDGLNFTAVRYLCANKFQLTPLPNCMVSVTWNFGDGTSATQEKSPMHAFTATGTYQVSATVQMNCGGCTTSKTVTKVLNITVPTPEEATMPMNINVTTDTRAQVIANSVTTFSPAWVLPYEATSIANRNQYWNGSDGIWRNDGAYAYQVPRSQAADVVNTRTDGTFNMASFNWKYAEENAVPNWINANTITQYNAYGFEIENKDVLDVYSSALYDFGGQLPVANGVNMKNAEMAFTGFESILDASSANGTISLQNLTSGNWIFGNQPLPLYTFHEVVRAQGYMTVIKSKPSALTNGTLVDILADRQTLVKNSRLVCTMAHPETTEWSMAVFDKAPTQSVWRGQIRITNNTEVPPLPNIDAGVAHSGRYSLKVTAPQTFKQEILKLEAGKYYQLSAWVSINNPHVATSPIATGLGVEIKFYKRITNAFLKTELAQPLPVDPIIEGWQRIKFTFLCDTQDSYIELGFKPGGGGTAWYDDLRLHPVEGNMKSYVYDPVDFKLKAILDEENFASYFYYDKEGNLFLTKKETKEGIKTLTENITHMKSKP